MSYDAGDGIHEGWAAHYFADGSVTCGWRNGGPMTTFPGISTPDDDLTRSDMPAAERWNLNDSLGAVFVCSCGWRSRHRPKEDPDDDENESEMHAEWKDHLRFWEVVP